MDQLIKYGQVKRGVLGVQLYSVNADIAKEFGLTETTGALVAGVAQGSAAERAGIKTGDIITSLNGVTMKSSGELRNAIGMLHVGDKVELGSAARRQTAQSHRVDRRALGGGICECGRHQSRARWCRIGRCAGRHAEFW